MELSKRLNTIASFVTEGCCAADIGTDHGYIPIYLVRQGICPRAFAMDINAGPLERAKQHIAEMGAADRISCLLSDGLDQLPEKDVDSVIIAGMGGDLIVKILDQDQDKLKEVRELIVSPQSHPERVRRWLHDHNFRILEEERENADRMGRNAADKAGRVILWLEENFPGGLACMAALEAFSASGNCMRLIAQYGCLPFEQRCQRLMIRDRERSLQKEIRRLQNP